MTTKMIFEAEISPETVSYEDGGAAVIISPDWKSSTNIDNHMFIEFKSYDEHISDNPLYDISNSKRDRASLSHDSIRSLFNKKVRVTIEIVD